MFLHVDRLILVEHAHHVALGDAPALVVDAYTQLGQTFLAIDACVQPG